MSLDPLYSAVSWALLRWHDVLTDLGLPGRSSLVWLASIALLVLTIRLCLLPLVIRQVRAQRRLQALQPQLKAIRCQHPKDLVAQQAALADLGASNALSGCLPLLAQWPIFIALAHVMRALGGDLPANHWAIAVAVLLSASASYLGQRLAQAHAPGDGPNARLTRVMTWLVPVSVVGSGLFFPFGLLWYWCVSNLVTVAQQLYLNRRHPPISAPATPPARPSRSAPAGPIRAPRSRASGRTR